MTIYTDMIARHIQYVQRDIILQIILQSSTRVVYGNERNNDARISTDPAVRQLPHTNIKSLVNTGGACQPGQKNPCMLL